MVGRVELQVGPDVAILTSLALSFVFVGSLHLWRLCGFEELDRNEEGTIKRRCVSTLASCALAGALVCHLAEPLRGEQLGTSVLPLDYGQLFGLCTAEAPRACLQSLVLTASLFLGPLLQHALGVHEGYVLLVSVPDNRWTALRDVVMAPLTEELFFRACLVRLWDAASISEPLIIFIGPLVFALAHAHHFVEKIRRHESKTTAFLQVIFQVLYTSLFGMFASFILLRTGSTWAAVVSHMFCNHQGFPDVSFFSDVINPLHGRRYLLAAVYLVGIVVFGCLLFPLTAGFEPLFRCMLSAAPDPMNS